jgi:hypothetical protein
VHDSLAAGRLAHHSLLLLLPCPEQRRDALRWEVRQKML